MKQLGLASHLYGTDNEDLIPFCGGIWQHHFPNWLYTFKSSGPDSRYQVELGQLWPYLKSKMQGQVYTCSLEFGHFPATSPEGRIENSPAVPLPGSSPRLHKSRRDG